MRRQSLSGRIQEREERKIRRPPLGVNAVYAQLLCCSALLLNSHAQLHTYVVYMLYIRGQGPGLVKRPPRRPAPRILRIPPILRIRGRAPESGYFSINSLFLGLRLRLRLRRTTPLFNGGRRTTQRGSVLN